MPPIARRVASASACRTAGAALLALAALCAGAAPACAGPGHGEAAEMGVGAPMEDLVVTAPDGRTLRMTADPKISTVGELTTFHVDVEETAGGKAVKGVVFEVEIAHAEHGVQVFGARGVGPEGSWTFQYQFFDGSNYTLKLRALPASGDGWQPIAGAATVQVRALEPPPALVIRIMALLLGAMALGMALGYAVRRGIGGGARA
ncbi:MAG: hypothetical protein HZA54_20725 [Planctomycetes bacterium]|nr:hypothetical protein [Planctomycetota bacterium]